MSRRFEILPLADIGEPENAARTEMETEGMDSLVDSIRKLGVLEPLLVLERDGEGFEVVAGHRRLLASRIAGLTELPCIVVDDVEEADAIKIHENLEREELTPSDEAIYYAELYEKHGEDTERVAELVKRSLGHVEGRLNLLRGDKHVFDALAKRKIPIGVANELNKFEREDGRLFHLDYAVRTGATVATVRQWRIEDNTRWELERDRQEADPEIAPRSAEDEALRSQRAHVMAGAAPHELSTGTGVVPCALCDSPAEEWRMLKKHLCPDCAEHVWPRFQRAMKGESV